MNAPQRRLGFYRYGATPLYASRFDQRLSYCLYVPSHYHDDVADPYALVVVVHATDRTAQGYRDAFAEFAEAHRAIVLAPLFPAGVDAPGDLEGYKLIRSGGLRYDLALLSILDEVAELYRVDARRVLLHGFSGGGHFAHRFLYLHPERLRAVSIGAPGLVTLLDDTRPWWVGVADVEGRFGRALDLAAIRAVPVQTVIGAEDVQTWEITIPPGSALWVEGANDAGVTRLDRIDALAASLRAAGADVRRDVVPGVAHRGWPLVPVVQEFFADVLSASPRSRT
jgi:poly(3-hydroxybutyrate) depolymerase